MSDLILFVILDFNVSHCGYLNALCLSIGLDLLDRLHGLEESLVVLFELGNKIIQLGDLNREASTIITVLVCGVVNLQWLRKDVWYAVASKNCRPEVPI